MVSLELLQLSLVYAALFSSLLMTLFSMRPRSKLVRFSFFLIMLCFDSLLPIDSKNTNGVGSLLSCPGCLPSPWEQLHSSTYQETWKVIITWKNFRIFLYHQMFCWFLLGSSSIYFFLFTACVFYYLCLEGFFFFIVILFNQMAH